MTTLVSVVFKGRHRTEERFFSVEGSFYSIEGSYIPTVEDLIDVAACIDSKKYMIFLETS